MTIKLTTAPIVSDHLRGKKVPRFDRLSNSFLSLQQLLTLFLVSARFVLFNQRVFSSIWHHVSIH